MKIEQQIIPALSSMKEVEKFLDSEDTYGILMNLHLGLLDGIIKEAHRQEKRILLHLDLTRGLTADVCGCEYACQILQVDGIISTKVKVIESAKKCGKTAILRFFLIDSKSLEKGIAICNSILPDYVEVLPGIAYEIIPRIKSQVPCEIMCGGLIQSMEQVEQCIRAGACAVTISEKYKKMK
jgi:glycerol uptake operon antiterminator